MNDILQTIVDKKRETVAAMKAATSLGELQSRIDRCPTVLDLAEALRGTQSRGKAGAGPVPIAPADTNIIAEIKRKSPSKGEFPWHGNAVRQAVSYEMGGARAISVVTDEPFFGGSPDLLRQVKTHTRLPVLQKEFVIDPYQIHFARALGADAVLLIAAILPEQRLTEFLSLAREVGIGTLVEVVNSEELQRAQSADAKVIGINNRDLKTFTTDLRHTLELLPEFDDDRVAVTESGIHSRADVELMLAAGVDAFLIGEALMAADDPAAHLNILRGRPVSEAAS